MNGIQPLILLSDRHAKRERKKVPRCHYFRPENLFSLAVSVSCAPSAHFYAYKTFALGGKRVLSVSILCCCCWVFQHKKRGEHDALSFIPPYYSRLHYFYVPIFVCPLSLAISPLLVNKRKDKKANSFKRERRRKENKCYSDNAALCSAQNFKESPCDRTLSLFFSATQTTSSYIFSPTTINDIRRWRKVAKFFLFASAENIYLRRRKHRGLLGSNYFTNNALCGKELRGSSRT